MALSEFVTPILSAGGSVALTFVLLRFGSDAVERVADAVARLLLVRSVTKPESATGSGNEKVRCETRVKMLRILKRRDDGDDNSPPSVPAAS